MSIVQSRARSRSRGAGGKFTRGVAAVGRGLSRARGARGMKRHRARGITARELRGFRKVTNLLRKVGMHPRGLGRTVHRRK